MAKLKRSHRRAKTLAGGKKKKGSLMVCHDKDEDDDKILAQKTLENDRNQLKDKI